MLPETYLFGEIFVLFALLLMVAVFVWGYGRAKGVRVVTCPETKESAAVKVDTRHAALNALLDRPGLRLTDCSLWPERSGCPQECLKEIESTPNGCRVRAILAEWYAGKTCVLCSRPLGDMSLSEHKPALMNPDHITLEWKEIPPEVLPQVLKTYLPVCWNCHVAETFRREFPELVIDRGRKAKVSGDRR